MAKIITDVVLKDGVDETTFINDITSNTEVDLFDRVSNLNNMVVLNVEQDYINTLRSHSSVLSADFFENDPAPITYPTVPSTYTLANKSIGGTTYWTNYDGTDMLSYQHYLDTDHIPDPTPDRTINSFTGHNVGNHYYYSSPVGERDQIRHFGPEPASDGGRYGSASTYYTTYTGKNVDIVTLEGGTEYGDSDYLDYHSSHPDWRDPDNLSTTRMIPMNWPGLSHSSMNQVTPNIMLNSHATGTLSAAGGLYGGFAKRSSLRAAYLTGTGITAALNSIKTWHESKSTNSETGFPNPTIIITEWHSPTISKDRYVRLEDISAITDPTHGTENRPGGGWGSDYTPFILRNLIPFQLKDPVNNSWYWCLGMSASVATSQHTAIEQCWDAGIHVVTSLGNGGAVYCRTTDAEYNGTYITMDSSYNLYSIIYPASGSQNDPITISRSTSNDSTWYPLRPYGPGGSAKSINVAAGMNSEGCPALDNYTSRGPGVDLIGRGSITWTAGDPTASQLTDGNRWGLFGGTSCAMPTVAGKLACYIEKHYTINGVYPTPDQAKASMVAEAKATAMSVKTTNWSSVPEASGTTIDPGQQPNDGACLKIEANSTTANGGTRFLDHAGTPSKQAYWNAQNFNREQTYKKRPTSGVLFPRPRKFDIAPVEESAT